MTIHAKVQAVSINQSQNNPFPSSLILSNFFSLVTSKCSCPLFLVLQLNKIIIWSYNAIFHSCIWNNVIWLQKKSNSHFKMKVLGMGKSLNWNKVNIFLNLNNVKFRVWKYMKLFIFLCTDSVILLNKLTLFTAIHIENETTQSELFFTYF